MTYGMQGMSSIAARCVHWHVPTVKQPQRAAKAARLVVNMLHGAGHEQ
jgi:hypothetical protein